MDPRGKEKERPANNNLEAHSRKGEVQSRVAVLERGAHSSVRQESMESTCVGPMRHLGAREQVKVKVSFLIVLSSLTLMNNSDGLDLSVDGHVFKKNSLIFYFRTGVDVFSQKIESS